MIGAIFLAKRCTTARKISGSKVFIDLVKASHGPQYIPETRASNRMLIISHVFNVRVLCYFIDLMRL